MKLSELKKIVESEVRKLYAESIDEDMEKRNAVYGYMKKVLHPDHEWAKARQDASRPQRGRMTAKLLKRIFARLADRSFVNSLVTIHWGHAENIIYTLKKVSSKDELSCAAYMPGDVHKGSIGSVGLLVNGYITILANNMDELFTGHGKQTGEDFPLMKKTSGINKGVYRYFLARDFYRSPILVFDKEDWEPDDRLDFYRNEALVDNWTAQGIVFENKEQFENPKNQELIEMAKEQGLSLLTIDDL